MGANGSGDTDTAGTLRGIVVIVAVGLALGASYNALGRASRPPRGLPWVKPAEQVVTLDDFARDSTAVVAAPDSAPAPAPVAAPSSASAPSSAAPSKPAAGKPATPTAPPPTAGATGPTTTTTAPPASAAGLPVIPDLDRPIDIGLESLKKLYDAGAVLVVDARSIYEYEDGHIAGAVSLPFTDALTDPGRIARLGEAGRPIVVYCSGGGCELSRDLAKLMLENGRKKVLVYEGGWPEWASFEYPSARGAQPGSPR